MPSIDRVTMSILRPVVEDAHFKIKPAIIQMIQNTLQFYGMTHEDPNQHITNFLEIYDTFKQMGVDHDDTIHLRLFLFSLKDKAKSWLDSLELGRITNMGRAGTKFSSKILSLDKDYEASE